MEILSALTSCWAGKCKVPLLLLAHLRHSLLRHLGDELPSRDLQDDLRSACSPGSGGGREEIGEGEEVSRGRGAQEEVAAEEDRERDWGTLSEGLEAANAEEGETGRGERQALGGGTSRISAPAKGSVMAARAWFPSI